MAAGDWSVKKEGKGVVVSMMIATTVDGSVQPYL